MEFKLNYATCGDNDSTNSHRLIKIMLPWETSICTAGQRKELRDSQTIYSINIALGCVPEHERKIPLLKAPHTLVTGI